MTEEEKEDNYVKIVAAAAKHGYVFPFIFDDLTPDIAQNHVEKEREILSSSLKVKVPENNFYYSNEQDIWDHKLQIQIEGKLTKKLLTSLLSSDTLLRIEDDLDGGGYILPWEDTPDLIKDKLIQCKFKTKYLEISILFKRDLPLLVSLYDKIVYLIDEDYKQGYGELREYSKSLNLKEPKDLPSLNQEQTNQQTNLKGTVMKTLSTTAQINKNSAVLAAKVGVGKAGNKLVKGFIVPHMPMGTKSFAEKAWFNLIIANLVTLGVNQFAADNQKARVITQAMLDSAQLDILEEFNIEEIVESLTSKISGKKLDLLMEEADNIVVD